MTNDLNSAMNTLFQCMNIRENGFTSCQEGIVFQWLKTGTHAGLFTFCIPESIDLKHYMERLIIPRTAQSDIIIAHVFWCEDEKKGVGLVKQADRKMTKYLDDWILLVRDL